MARDDAEPPLGRDAAGSAPDGAGTPLRDEARQRAKAAEAWQMLSGLFEATRLMPAQLRAAAGSLPLTVIGGFLGAGKTTLLNRLLSAPGGRRVAVLVNDFGRIDIDAALIRSRTDDMISLANGCACCSVAGDLTKALIALAQREDPPDAIVLEASGLADPRGIAQVALANPALRLDGLLTVVDAETLGDRLADRDTGPMVTAQIDAADMIVLAKLDLLSADGQARARRLLDARPVVEASHGDLPADVVLGIGSRRDLADEPVPAVGHASPFRSWTLEARSPLDRGRTMGFLAALPPAVIRAKGLVDLADAPAHANVFQRVGRRWSLDAGDRWPTDDRRTQIVLLGPEGAVDETALGRSFESCRRPPP